MSSFTFNMDMLATLRDAVGTHMAEMGERNPDMVVAVADVATSSRVNMFAERFPERFYNVGIAEQNLMSFSAGMAHEGFMPYAFSFAPFASMRCCEQIRTDICYNGLPVRIIGNGAGYSNAESGATHCALEDVAITTAMGNMTVIEPGDPFQIQQVLNATIDWPGPIYIRMGREATGSLYPEDSHYQIGQAGIPVPGDDGAFIGSGIVVHHAVEASRRLDADFGAKVRVVDMHTIKPLDIDAVLDAAKTGHIIAAQDHSIVGGLGYAVGTALAEAGIGIDFEIRGCPDHYVPIATPGYLYSLNGYDADGLYNAMKTMLHL
jgi:transketolase